MPQRSNFSSRVYDVVRRIPKGKVATYGQIAALVGSPRGAQAVGWVMHSLDVFRYPWHRVINRMGMISTTCETHTRELQKQLLQAEGVEVNERDGDYWVN